MFVFAAKSKNAKEKGAWRLNGCDERGARQRPTLDLLRDKESQINIQRIILGGRDCLKESIIVCVGVYLVL
jgi:hypothetical protein